MSTTVKEKNDSPTIDKKPDAEFEKLTCSDDDYERDDDDDCVSNEPKDKVLYCSTIPLVPLVKKKEDPGVVTILFYWAS